MRRSALALAAAIGFTLAGTANAGVITATYNLAGSTLTTTSFLGTDTDQITGTVTIQYGAASINGPISFAALVAGAATTLVMNPNTQPGAGQLTLNGSTTTTVTAPGAGGPIGAATIALAPAPGTVTGSLHCTGGFCGLAGFVASVPQTVFPPAPLALATAGGVVFTSGQAGLGNWAGVPYTITQAGGQAVLSFAYVGQEVSRTFVPEPGTASLLGLGLAVLAGAGSFSRRHRMR
jgi:hypothetical protein